jgi:hypothetical protein
MDKTTKIDQHKATTPARRKFLLGATLGTAAAVGVAVAGGAKDAIEAAVPGASAADSKTKGYHLTAHIAQYYDTTRM